MKETKDEKKQEPPVKVKKCRWCGKEYDYTPVPGFCSRRCATEMYGDDP